MTTRDSPSEEELIDPPASSVDQFLIRHFSRITSGGTYLPEIDGLRFIAIGAVLVAHFLFYFTVKRNGQTWISAPDQVEFVRFLHLLGVRGVLLFFVISGFILAVPFARTGLKGGRRVSISSYLWRRVTRLEPPYILCMIALGLVAVVVPKPDLSRVAAIQSVGASLLYSHGWFYGTKSPLNFVTWSLEVEIQFYLLMPLFGRIYRIRPDWFRRLILIGGMIGNCIITTYPTSWMTNRYYMLSVMGYLEYFLGGMLLADLMISGNPAWNRVRYGWDPVFVLALLFLAFEPDGLKGPILGVLATCLVFVAGRQSVWPRKFLSLVPVRTIGGMCYSIYLWHMFLISIVGMITMRVTAGWPLPLDFLAQGLILLTAIVILSSLAFVLVERPCMQRDWPARLMAWWKRREPMMSEAV